MQDRQASGQRRRRLVSEQEQAQEQEAAWTVRAHWQASKATECRHSLGTYG